LEHVRELYECGPLLSFLSLLLLLLPLNAKPRTMIR
jgi:hypothetical protein